MASGLSPPCPNVAPPLCWGNGPAHIAKWAGCKGPSAQSVNHVLFSGPGAKLPPPSLLYIQLTQGGKEGLSLSGADSYLCVFGTLLLSHCLAESSPQHPPLPTAMVVGWRRRWVFFISRLFFCRVSTQHSAKLAEYLMKNTQKT